MKLNYLIGCTYNALTVDGKDIYNMQIDEVRDIIRTLIDKDNDFDNLHQIIVDYMYQKGEIDDTRFKCGSCGDYVEEFNLEI